MSHMITAQKIVGTIAGPHMLEVANISGKRVLVISDEGASKSKRLAEKCQDLHASSVVATHYGDKPGGTDEKVNWRKWDWINDDLCVEDGFDVIIARSMVCPCLHPDHVNMGTHALNGTCGGIPLPGKKAAEITLGDLDVARKVIKRVDDFIVHGGVAFFTNSPMPSGPFAAAGSYKLGRKYSLPMWKLLLEADYNGRFEMFLEEHGNDKTYIGFCITKQ